MPLSRPTPSRYTPVTTRIDFRARLTHDGEVSTNILTPNRTSGPKWWCERAASATKGIKAHALTLSPVRPESGLPTPCEHSKCP